MGWKLFEKLLKKRGGEGNPLNKVLMILYVVLVATELHPDAIFSSIFLPNNKMKNKNYPLSL